MLCIYMPFWGIAGSEIRVLKTIIRFPKDEYLIFIPIDYKASLIKSLVYLEKDRDFRKINEAINDTIELKPINNTTPRVRGIASRYASYKYGRYVAYTAKRYGCEMVYMPYVGNQTYVILGLKSSFPKVSVLIQNTPIIETLVFEEGDPLTIMINNTRLREGKSGLKLLGSSLIKFAKLFMWRFITTNVNLLTVSKSIPYELNKVGVNVEMKVINPGVGVDPCPFSGLDRVFDVVFFARVTPEKGVFDFLRVVANLVRWRRNIKALVMGFAGDEMAVRVREMAGELGIAGNVEFRFNAPRDEAMRLLAQSKLVIYPTRLDSISLSVLEALSCGTPVIAYAIPAIRFNYADTRAVIKTKPLDIEEMTRMAIETLEGEAWRELGREAVEFAKKYTWENTAKTEWNTLQSIMNLKYD